MGIKNRIRKLIAYTLIFSLILTIFPTDLFTKPVYAADSQYVVGSEGTDASGSTVGKGWQAWQEEYQGIRVSIVDRYGNNVLWKDSGGARSGIDILFSNVNYYYYEDSGQYNKFDTEKVAYERYTWDNIKTLLQASAESHPLLDSLDMSKDLERPVIKRGGEYSSNGEKVKEFFITGELTGLASQAPVHNINAGNNLRMCQE